MASIRWLNDRRLRGLALQALVLVAVVGVLAWFADNAATAMRRQGVASGFAYMSEEAGFGIGEGLLAFSPADSYGWAFVVGLTNTLAVSVVAIVAATGLGLVIGLMRLSGNAGVAALATTYVEVFRGTPQLLQIVFWYAVMTRLPRPRQALELGFGAVLSNRGLVLPVPVLGDALDAMMAALAIGVIGAWALRRHAAAQQARTGARPAWVGPLAAFLAPALVAFAWLAQGAPTALERPALRGLNFVGGVTLSPEFLALFLGLALYTAAFIAEIVRGGVLAVPKGQLEAARCLGLRPGQIQRFVLIPQALRIMIPPTASQYVSLAKSSSLAVAIGYPDLVNISNTTINQTGHTIEVIALMSLVYLVISFTIAVAMNLYNRAVAIAER